MKVKLDENLPETLLSELAALRHDVDNIRQEGLAGSEDADVWNAAQNTGRITNENDRLVFRKDDIRSHEPTPGPSAEGNSSARAI
jgi:predicted nuclease of predicted toxin-antitoxin system